MSHHFDTPTGRQDPRINLCDFYVFRGSPGTTVMAMTVNPDAGLSAPETFRDEGLYAFRFDLDGDAREDVSFTIRFGAVAHGAGDGHAHVQSFEVHRAAGAAEELLIAGCINEIAKTDTGIMAFAGLAPDLFAGDGAALGRFRTAFYEQGRFDPEVFQNRKNLFAKRNVTAIVLEIPTPLIGHGAVHCWATISLHGHAPEVQVSRWGVPLLTNIFMTEMEMREDYNRTGPADNVARFAPHIAEVAAKLTALAGSAANPGEYANRLVARICPTTLPYRLGTAAGFDFAGFNGRALTDDVMDVMLTLATNTAIGDGVAPDKTRVRAGFPYFGKPYTSAEQSDLAPAVAKKG